jgi:hypothetical protein
MSSNKKVNTAVGVIDADIPHSFSLPDKAFFTLSEACAVKGINCKTARNKRILQPNKGIPDGKLGGRKVWSYETISNWIRLLDNQIMTDEGVLPF